MAEKERKDDSSKQEPLPDFFFANQISPGTLVRLLIRKGILTVEEIVEEEKKAREHSLAKISPQSYQATSHRSHAFLKRFFARYKFTRKLSSRLFGWEWKKRYKRPILSSKNASNDN